MSRSVFVMCQKGGPIFELAPNPETAATSDGPSSYHFVLHAALDLVEENAWSNSQTFLKTIDRYKDLSISAFVSSGGCVLLLMHDNKSDDNVRNFFKEVHELYVKVLLNPFYEWGTAIKSKDFEARVRVLMKTFVF
eukprot:g5286.t1